MIPKKKEYEQVKVDEWLSGEIEDIQYEKDREFTYKGVKSNNDAARIVMSFDGYKDKKMTPWFKFNYAAKSNLYKIFLSSLVEGAHPNMQFDLDNLKGLRIRAMYEQNGEYQNLTMVRPLVTKILPGAPSQPPSGEKVPY